MINLASLSFHFDPVEDRIRLIGNLSNSHQRIDFWLTRRLVLRLLDASDQLIKKTSEKVSQMPAEHQSAMAQFEHDEAQQQQSVLKEESLDHTDETVQLLQRLDISFRDGRYQLGFFENGQAEATGFSILSYAEMHQILHWLHKGCQQLEWGAPSVLFDSGEIEKRLQ